MAQFSGFSQDNFDEELKNDSLSFIWGSNYAVLGDFDCTALYLGNGAE